VIIVSLVHLLILFNFLRLKRSNNGFNKIDMSLEEVLNCGIPQPQWVLSELQGYDAINVENGISLKRLVVCCYLHTV